MISMTSWKNRLQRMLFLDKLQPLVGQMLNVAEFGTKSARNRGIQRGAFANSVASTTPPTEYPYLPSASAFK